MPPGRSGPDLLARLLELESFVARLEPSGAYAGHSEPAQVPSNSLSNACGNAGDPLLVPTIVPTEDTPQLAPYRSLDVSRLRLHGRGDWGIEACLEGPLWLPFLEPLILRHGFALAEDDLPDLCAEDPDENLALAKLWDVNGLLELLRPLPPSDSFARTCRIFNAFKSEVLDRQIGDRRPANRSEYHLSGPSKELPQGHLLTALQLDRYRETIRGFVSDRKDYYHQVRASAQRCDANRLPFAYPAFFFQGTGAMNRLIETSPSRGRSSVLVGDYVPAFRSLLQGDHHGVEFALEGHQQMLSQHGALIPGLQLLGGRTPPASKTWQAVVIDDLVNLAVVPRAELPLEPSLGQRLHERALSPMPQNVLMVPLKKTLRVPSF